jgi:hypothetical protein
VPKATISEEMRPAWHQPSSEQEHAKERRLEKKRHQPFIGHQRREHVRGGIGEPAPVRSKLKRHDDSGDHAHPEGDGENLRPISGDAKPQFAAREEVEPFQYGDIGRKSNRERGQ